MINPPDDLLEDLQQALPPEAQAYSSSNAAKWESASRGSAEMSVSTPSHPQQFDEAQYSEVRRGPIYTPKSPPNSVSPPPTKPPRTAPAASEGLSELDSLLAMLGDTQAANQEKPPHDTGLSRPTISAFVDELTQLENQVSNKTSASKFTTGGIPMAAPVTASSATKELDDLMANLSKFEPSTVSVQDDKAPKGAQPKTRSALESLNSMLGSLEEDMSKRHGVSTMAKGTCAACNKIILGKVVNALNMQWHPEHFTCASCDAELGQVTYYESNGRPYCEKDYNELFAPRCAYCNGPILEKVMRALDRTWHPEHFFCTLCGKHFGTDGFHEKDGKAFCRECYYEKFAPRCKRCEKAIMEGFITALNAQWHPDCFTCKVCNVSFPRGNYFDHEGEPHCEIHYHAARGTLCASCQKPVVGKCVSAMGKKFHPEHFTCAFCLKLLNKGTFKEHRSNPYCQACYIKLFG